MVQKHDSIILLVDKVLYPLGRLKAIYKKPTNYKRSDMPRDLKHLRRIWMDFIHTLQPSDCNMASQTYDKDIFPA